MDSLSLRFTEAETSLAPPDLAAFTAVDRALSRLLQEQLADHDDSSALQDLLAGEVIASRMQILVDCEPGLADAPVFVTLRSAPIPAIEVETPGAGDLAAFALKDHVHGHFAWPMTAAGKPSRASRAALVMAVCVPLALPDAAMAQAPARTTATASPAVVPARTAPTASPAVVPTPPAPAAVVEAPALPPPPATAPPQVEGPATPTLQTILQAMRGHEGVVFTADTKITGLILSVEGEFVVMVNAERDGKIAMIPKAQIIEVRGKARTARAPGPVDLPDGTGMLAGGGILTALGAPLMLSGLVFVGIIPSGTSIYLPQVLPAAVLLGGGIPLLVFGSRRRRAYNSAVMQTMMSGRLTPAVNRTPHGSWTGGLSLRF